MNPIKLETIYRTVLVTDARNSSKAYFSNKADEALLRIERDRLVFAEIAAGYGGEEVRDRGDGSMFAFNDPHDAIAAAMEMQDAIKAYNASLPAETLHLIHRMGVEMGEIKLVTAVYHLNGATSVRRKMSGDMVVTAARLEAICHPGEVCFSNTVYKAIRGKIDHDFRCLDTTLKGFARPVRCWSTRLDPTWARPLTAEEEQMKAKQLAEKRLREKWERELNDKRRRRLLLLALIPIALLGAAYPAWQYVRFDDELAERAHRAWVTLRTPIRPQTVMPHAAGLTTSTAANLPQKANLRLSHSKSHESHSQAGADTRNALVACVREGLEAGDFDALATRLSELDHAPKQTPVLINDARSLAQLKDWMVEQMNSDDKPNQVQLASPIAGFKTITAVDDTQIRGENENQEEVSIPLGQLDPDDLAAIVSTFTETYHLQPTKPAAEYQHALARLRNIVQ